MRSTAGRNDSCNAVTRDRYSVRDGNRNTIDSRGSLNIVAVDQDMLKRTVPREELIFYGWNSFDYRIDFV